MLEPINASPEKSELTVASLIKKHGISNLYFVERVSKKGNKKRLLINKEDKIAAGSFGSVYHTIGSARIFRDTPLILNDRRKYDKNFLVSNSNIETFIAEDVASNAKKPTLSFVLTGDNECYLVDRSYKIFTAQGPTWSYKKINFPPGINFKDANIDDYLNQYTTKKEIMKLQEVKAGEEQTVAPSIVSQPQMAVITAEVNHTINSGFSHVSAPVFIKDPGNGKDFIAFKMPYIDEAVTLKDLIDVSKWTENKKILGLQQQSLTGEDIREITQAGLQALKYIHEQNIIHCDIKPENIMVKRINGKWSVVLLDYGLAKKRGESVPAVGSPLYVASHVLQKSAQGAWLSLPCEPQHDLFSFAVSMLELLGTPPSWFIYRANGDVLLNWRCINNNNFCLTQSPKNLLPVNVSDIELFKNFFKKLLENRPSSAQDVLDQFRQIDQPSSALSANIKPTRVWGASTRNITSDTSQSQSQLGELFLQTGQLAEQMPSFVTPPVLKEKARREQEERIETTLTSDRLQSETLVGKTQNLKTGNVNFKMRSTVPAQQNEKSWFSLAYIFDWFKSFFGYEDQPENKDQTQKLTNKKEPGLVNEKNSNEPSLLDNLLSPFSCCFAEVDEIEETKVAATPKTCAL